MRVVVHTKSNHGPLASSLLFEPIASADGVVHIEWRGECDYTADDLLSRRITSGSKSHEAEEMLIEILKGGPMEVSDIQRAAAALAQLPQHRCEMQNFGNSLDEIWV